MATKKTLHRFFVSPSSINNKKATIINHDQIHQITHVLRMKPGDTLILLNGDQKEYLTSLKNISKKEITGHIIKKQNNKGEPPIIIRLFQAIPKQLTKFEQTLRQGTEIGISEFYPLLTEHGEAQELHKRERMMNILKEAAEQSERGKIPILGPIIIFKKLLENSFPAEINADLNLLAYERENKTFLKNILAHLDLAKVKTINIFIGPEGGFSPTEIEAARLAPNFTIFGLGPRILRTETAGLVISGSLLYS
ncbi:MAG: 16S rRNA methyltransferase [Candidatus Peregrinibacteria bacterium GW2011_GWE2_39_6]|nr:MAG: 16S rRNA methyltransferase [Candidatus Peregrinibacteria bacterium GW2011_GWF2_39_17]KKR25722.1 MAG: 16S rRNA methyltransferase [Candidatus Peregrinibacteria bacterium GW2011_GWE2_39_6]HCW32901.1 16S rRNA methyltransferase [Candidatus Peregrinibacteria bacterium]